MTHWVNIGDLNEWFERIPQVFPRQLLAIHALAICFDIRQSSLCHKYDKWASNAKSNFAWGRCAFLSGISSRHLHDILSVSSDRAFWACRLPGTLCLAYASDRPIQGISSDILLAYLFKGVQDSRLPGTLPGISSDILSAISSDILSGISSRHSITAYVLIGRSRQSFPALKRWQRFWQAYPRQSSRHSIWHIFWYHLTFFKGTQAWHISDILTGILLIRFWQAFPRQLYHATMKQHITDHNSVQVCTSCTGSSNVIYCHLFFK